MHCSDWDDRVQPACASAAFEHVCLPGSVGRLPAWLTRNSKGPKIAQPFSFVRVQGCEVWNLAAWRVGAGGGLVVPFLPPGFGLQGLRGPNAAATGVRPAGCQGYCQRRQGLGQQVLRSQQTCLPKPTVIVRSTAKVNLVSRESSAHKRNAPQRFRLVRQQG